jgi:hypothetical protein
MGNAPKSMRASVCLYALVLCGCAPDLPDGQVLTSPHFRYHARAETVVDPTVMDRLEARREEFDTWFGIDSPLVDYYLFKDNDDLVANSPCPDRACASSDSTIYTSAPLHEHELVHALLFGVGNPAPIVAEGIAQHVACVQPNFAAHVSYVPWQKVARVSGKESTDVYNFGQRLTAWMLAERGPKAFISFYGRSLPTLDPALFAVQFESFWGRRIGDVAAELDDDRFQGSSCPCTAPALPDDGAPASFVVQQDYRTFEVSEESRVQLESDGPLIVPVSCPNALDHGAEVFPTQPVTTTVARVGPGRFSVLGWPTFADATVTVRQTHKPQREWSCEAAAAAPIEVGAGDVALWVTSDRADAEGTWFAIDTAGPRTLKMLSEEGLAIACPACGACAIGASLSNDAEVTVPGGVALVRLMRGPSSDHTSVGVLLRHPAP